jgi:hypothetical protein
VTPTRRGLFSSKGIPDFDSQAGLATLDPLEPAFSQRREDDVGSIQPAAGTLSFDPNISSKPIMPPDTPKVRIAGSCLSKSDDSDRRPEPPTSLHDFTIPSPLLYHKKSREDLLGSEDNHNLNHNPVICGQETLAPVHDLNSFRLGSPLHQAAHSRNQSQSQSSSSYGAKLPVLNNNHGFSLAEEPTLNQCMQKYSPTSPQRDDHCTATAVFGPQIERPIVTTTNLLRKRKTHVFPGESVLSSSAITSSLACIHARHLVAADIQQGQSATVSIVKELDLPGGKDEVHSDAGLPPPPLMLYEQSLSESPTRTVNVGRNQRPKISRLTCGRSLTGVTSEDETRTLYDASSDLSDSGEMVKARYGRSQSSSGIKRRRKSIADYNPIPNSTSKFSLLERSNMTSGAAPPSTPTTTEGATSSTTSADGGIMNLEACSTPSCTALLTRKAMPRKETTIEVPQHEVANVAAIAQDLGFVVGHIDSCTFPSGWNGLGFNIGGLWTAEKGQESDAEADVHVQEGESCDRKEDDSVSQAEGSSPRVKGDMDDMVISEGAKDNSEDGLGADWMGEGREFWGVN